MSKYLQENKPFLLFLAKFFSAYFLLTILYRFYLESLPDGKIDKITTNVAYLVQSLAKFCKLDILVIPDIQYFKIIYNGVYVARIIEGCNAISVIILFISFIVAFSGKGRTTLFFLFGGSLLIYLLNVFRIILLTILLSRFPKEEHLLHGVLFPLVIYGIVFLLWLIWVNKFSGYASKSK